MDYSTLPHFLRAEESGLIQQKPGFMISRYPQECGVNLLMLGALRGTTANVISDDTIEQFAHTSLQPYTK